MNPAKDPPSEVVEESATTQLLAAMFCNTFKSVVATINQTGLQTNQLRYASPDESKSTLLAEEFLLNSRLTRCNVELPASVYDYFQDPSLVMLAHLGKVDHNGTPQFERPKRVQMPMSLQEALQRRRSHREFTGQPCRSDYLATLLRAANGVTAQAKVELVGGGQCTLNLRSAPSGGGLFPIDIVVVLTQGTDLPRKAYHYAPLTDELLEIGNSSVVDAVTRAFDVQGETAPVVSSACAIFLLIARPWRTMRKYGARGMRFMLIEAGCITQNIHLAATALGFGTLDFGGYYDDEIHQSLGIDGVETCIVHAILLGTI